MSERGGGLKNHLPQKFTYHTLDLGKENTYNFNLDSGRFPIKDNTYDVVICMETLEHVMYPEGVIQEIKRIAKKDAIFFFSLPNEYNFIQRIYFLFGKKTMVDEPFQIVEKHLHIHKPRVKDVINIFSKNFTIERIEYVWQSRRSMRSKVARIVDKILNNTLAKIYPSLFSRLVWVKVSNLKEL
jgi:2-polyprenyl-3-methyl-5-hydroxy-6-metoxy-1,4-benzoquinol methylase